MSKTYTFPQLILASGTFDITIKTSLGSGTELVSEKYFSSIDALVKETEVYGGSIRQDSVRLTIDYDKDQFFRDTIFASFAEPSGWVDILIQSNGVYEFYGTIDPTTIDSDRFYSDESEYESITFDSHWILRRLEKSKVEDLELLFDTVDCIQAQKRNLIGDTLSSYAYLFTIEYLFEKIFELLKSITGISTINVRIQLSTRYGAVSKDCFVDTGIDILPESTDSIPLVAIYLGDTDYTPFESFLLLWKYTNDSKVNTLWDSSDDKSDQSFYNTDNVYEVLVDILKSFGFILTIDSLTPTEINITIKDRVDGVNVDNVLKDRVESRKSLLTTEYLESISTSPKANNVDAPSYEFLLKANYGSSFSYTTAFKTEYIRNYGDAIYKNHLYAIKKTTAGTATLVNVAYALRDIMEGGRLNSNWDITDQIGGTPTGYTSGVGGGSTLDCVNHTIDNHTPNTNNSGCVLMTFPVDNSSTYLGVDVGSVDYEILVSFWVKFVSTAGMDSATGIDYTLQIYDSSSTQLAPENGAGEYSSGFNLSTVNSIGATDWRMVTLRVRPKRGEIVKYVRLYTVATFPTATVSMRMDDISIYRSHQYFHQLLGRKLQRYYANPNSKIKNTYNGIYSVNNGDNITDNGTTYYIKRIAKDYQNNTTEIEAINYQ